MVGEDAVGKLVHLAVEPEAGLQEVAQLHVGAHAHGNGALGVVGGQEYLFAGVAEGGPSQIITLVEQTDDEAFQSSAVAQFLGQGALFVVLAVGQLVHFFVGQFAALIGQEERAHAVEGFLVELLRHAACRHFVFGYRAEQHVLGLARVVAQP